jgi:5-formyltetrahydrofolate cyclo-ligase
MPFPEIPQSHDRKREMQNEREIRDFIVDSIISDPDFTHLITVNFARDIRNDSQRKQHNFQSQLAIQIQSICLNLSPKQVKKLDPKRVMKYCSTPEDFKKATSIRTARHFNIAVAMPALNHKMNQLRAKAAIEKLAQSIFKTKTTNCHIEEMPKQQKDRTCRVAYDYK